MNHKSIQILRGSATYDPTTSTEVLLDGQPFYSKKTKKLYIGDGVTELKNLQGTDIGLTAGDNITITNGVISATGGSDFTLPKGVNISEENIAVEGEWNPEEGKWDAVYTKITPRTLIMADYEMFMDKNNPNMTTTIKADEISFHNLIQEAEMTISAGGCGVQGKGIHEGADFQFAQGEYNLKFPFETGVLATQAYVDSKGGYHSDYIDINDKTILIKELPTFDEMSDGIVKLTNEYVQVGGTGPFSKTIIHPTKIVFDDEMTNNVDSFALKISKQSSQFSLSDGSYDCAKISTTYMIYDESGNGSQESFDLKIPAMESGTIATHEWVERNSTDIQINGTSIIENGVANIPIASASQYGVSKVNSYRGVKMTSEGNLSTEPATIAEIEAKTQPYHVIVPATLDYAVKVGLTTNKEILTDEEKAAAQAWLGISSGGTLPDGVTIAEKRITVTEDIDTGEDWGDGPIYDTNESIIRPSKILLDATRLADGTSHTISLDAENAITLSNVGTGDSTGVELTINSYGFQHSMGGTYYFPDEMIQTDNGYETLATQEWVQKNNSNTGGSGASIDVQINGTSIVENGVANIPIASTNTLGAIKLGFGGLYGAADGTVYIHSATKNEIDSKAISYKPITTTNLDYAVKVGLTTNTQILTDDEKQAAQTWLGISSGGGGGTLPDGIALSNNKITISKYDESDEMDDELTLSPKNISLIDPDANLSVTHEITLNTRSGLILASTNDSDDFSSEMKISSKDIVCQAYAGVGSTTLKFQSDFETFQNNELLIPIGENGTLATREWVQANPLAVTFPTGFEASESKLELINYEDDHGVDTLSITPRGINCEALDFYHFSIGGTAGAPCITLSNDNHTAQLETNDLSIYRNKIVRTTGYFNAETDAFDNTTNTYTFPNASGRLATEEWVQSNASGGKLYRQYIRVSNKDGSKYIETDFITSKANPIIDDFFNSLSTNINTFMYGFMENVETLVQGGPVITYAPPSARFFPVENTDFYFEQTELTRITILDTVEL